MPRFFHERTIPLWASVFTLAGVLILCGLGTWQVQRHFWKADLLAAIHNAYERDPALTQLDGAALRRAGMESPVFAYGTVAGGLRHDLSFMVGPRTHQGGRGYHVITPLRLQDGSGWILVNRGWVGDDFAGEALQTPPLTAQAAGALSGIVRATPRGNRFTPANNPERGQWYSIDPQQVAGHYGLDGMIDSVVLYAQTQTSPMILPLAGPGTWLPPNDHAGYALFWFVMAGALIAIYLLRFFYSSGSASTASGDAGGAS